jgi:DNA-nicking Smr family endonuclease
VCKMEYLYSGYNWIASNVTYWLPASDSGATSAAGTLQIDLKMWDLRYEEGVKDERTRSRILFYGGGVIAICFIIGAFFGGKHHERRTKQEKKDDPSMTPKPLESSQAQKDDVVGSNSRITTQMTDSKQVEPKIWRLTKEKLINDLHHQASTIKKLRSDEKNVEKVKLPQRRQKAVEIDIASHLYNYSLIFSKKQPEKHILDLHRLYVDIAMIVLEDRIREIRETRVVSLEIITGRGNNSKDGAKVKPEVVKYLKEEKHGYEEKNEGGSFLIRFSYE